MHAIPGERRSRAPSSLLRVAVAVALTLVCACDRDTGNGNRATERPPASVEALQSRYGALPLTQRLSGVVRGKNQVDVYPEISAVITEVLVENGDAVRIDQPLVRLKDTDVRQRLKQATANLEIARAELRRAEAQAKEARTDLERQKGLAEKSFATQADLDAATARAESADAGVQLAEARVEQSKAGVEEQKQNLARTVIRAPITGHVGNRDAEVGMLAKPGARVLTLGQLDSVRVQVVLTDRMLGYIEEGQRAEISTEGGTVSAPLSRISPFLNPISHSTEAEIDLTNPSGLLKPGMFVTVDVFYGESEEATLVPLSALYENPETGSVGVYVGAGDLDPELTGEVDAPSSVSLTHPVTFEFVPTEVIAQGRMEAAIRSVEPGAWVVTLGQNLLRGESAEARVRPVTWERVERLQRLQREDMMQDIIERETVR